MNSLKTNKYLILVSSSKYLRYLLSIIIGVYRWYTQKHFVWFIKALSNVRQALHTFHCITLTNIIRLSIFYRVRDKTIDVIKSRKLFNEYCVFILNTGIRQPIFFQKCLAETGYTYQVICI